MRVTKSAVRFFFIAFVLISHKFKQINLLVQIRRLSFLLTFLLFCTAVAAQITDLVFIGSVTVDGSKSYPYKLLVTDSGGIVTGYSVTDIMGPDETKTHVRGKLDVKKKQLTFKETRIMHTRSSTPEKDFCFISATLKAGSMQGANTLKGHFTGYKPDGKAVCGKGKIMLICAQDALAKLMEIAEKEKIERPDSLMERPINTDTVAEQTVKKVEPGETVTLRCSNPHVTLEIWDAKTIDGDRITLKRGDLTLLDNYSISNHKKKVEVDLGTESSVQLTLIANNEGSVPINTARIGVISGGDVHYIDASTTIGKSTSIVLKRE